MHYYKFNIADWHLGTSHLGLEEEAAYLRLINYYYDTEEPIPLETDRVFRRLRLGKGSDVGLSVLEEFFTKTGDGWIHERCDRELESYQEKADANRKNGKKGGRPKKNNDLGDNPDKPSGFLVGTQTEPTDNLNQEPLTTNHKPKEYLSSGDDLLGDPDQQKGPPPTPHRQIIDLYHEILPELPRVVSATWPGSVREKNLASRWKQLKAHQSLDFWAAFFEGVKRSPFHLGDNDRGWKANLGWLVERRNFDKIIERIENEGL